MKANPDYDPGDRKSVKFIRHRDVNRNSVLVYNVRTFNVDKQLYVELDSLIRLSHIRGRQCPLPATIPATHSDSQRRGPTGPTGSEGRTTGSEGRTRLRDESTKPVDNNARIEIFWTDENRWFKGLHAHLVAC